MTPAVAALVADAERMCRAVAPVDLRGLGVYVLPASAAEGWGPAAVCGGLTGPVFDLLFREPIGDRWRGRGPCLVVDDAAADIPDRFLSIALHELAHPLSEGWRFGDIPAPESIPPRVLATLRAEVVAAAAGPESFPLETLIRDHGPGFVRAAVHLADRAAAAGFAVYLPYVLAVGFPLSSAARTYRPALRPELETMRDRPFAEVRRSPVPAAVCDLWEADAARARWIDRQRPTKAARNPR